MDFDFEELISDAPRSGNMGESSTDALIRQLSAKPPAAADVAPPPPPPPSVYRPSGTPSYVPPPSFSAAARASPAAVAVNDVGTTAAAEGGGGGWWSGFTSMFGFGGASAAPPPRSAYSSSPYPASSSSGGFNADSATMVRKRKRKLLREMRQMVEADLAARARQRALAGGIDEDPFGSGIGGSGIGGGSGEPIQVRCTEASSLQEIEEEHDMVSEEHNERVGMDTARTFFVSGCGQAEWANDTYKPFGPGVVLQGFQEAVKDDIGDFESDIRTLRETVLGMGLPPWCYTAVKLGVTGGLIVAANRISQSMVDNGSMDAAVAFHPRVRDAIREVTARHMVEATTGGAGGGSSSSSSSSVARVGPGPPAFVNNKPRMPDPDTLPRPGAQPDFPTFPMPTPPFIPDQQMWHQQQQQGAYQPYQHDPFVYRPPAAHPNTQPIVHVPLRPPTVESSRDGPADRAAYRAQQNAFRDAQMMMQQQYTGQTQQPNMIMARPDLVPPPAEFATHGGAPYIRAPPPPPPAPAPWVPEEAVAAGGDAEEDVYAAMLREEQQEEQEQVVVGSKRRAAYRDDDGEDAAAAAEAAVAAGTAAAEAAETDARSVASSAAGGKRRRRTKQPAAVLLDDDLAMSMM